MQVLFVTSEIAPLIKTGGLADVSAALPAALHEMGVDVRVLLPGYAPVLKALPELTVAATFDALAGYPTATLRSGVLPSGVPIFVIDCPEMYLRGGGAYQDIYGVDWADNAHRFGLLSKVAAELGCAHTPLAWRPDIVHCNDWQAGLAPAYLHFSDRPAPCVMTIHNLAFQGIYPWQLTAQLGLPPRCFQPNGVEFYGNLSFLKAGLYYASHITTVSPSYAKEIQTDALGFGLQGLLAARSDVLTGILNGIDTREWDPATDTSLARTYDSKNLEAKSANKRELQRRMGLQAGPAIPLFGLVSRFTHQKGVDLVVQVAPQLLQLPAQLILLGSGDSELQRAVLELARAYPGQIGVHIGFEEKLSHLIEAGADIFLMPSRFEPCGLNQMYSQHYGTPPIVHATGGLIDSVVDYAPDAAAPDGASGFLFDQMDAAGLIAASQRAAAAYLDKKVWRQLQRNGMRRDFGWAKSATAYRDIYVDVMRRKI
ncbi:MAG: glycogen synthase GlgA [Pseudomonadota bacterium]